MFHLNMRKLFSRTSLRLVLVGSAIILPMKAITAGPGDMNETVATSQTLTVMDTPTTATLQAIDLDIMKAVRDWRLGDQSKPIKHKEQGPFVFIISENDHGKHKGGMFGPQLHTTDTLNQAFAERNDKAFRLRKIIAHCDILIIGDRKCDDLMKNDLYTKAFPDTKGFLYTWLPGYNKEKTEALINIYHTGSDDFSGLDMWGDMIRLKLQNKHWVVVSIEQAWIT